MKHKEKRIQENKGITLIALVVTIVVLIILATVSINAVLGQNGIIKKAKQAKEMYSNSIAKDKEEMDRLLNEMAEDDSNGGGSDTPTKPAAGTTVTKPGSWTSSQVTPIATGSNSAYAVNNIYDMAGNVLEWTIEAYDASGRVGRGGYHSNPASNYPASYRDFGYYPIYGNGYCGCRSTLYVK